MEQEIWKAAVAVRNRLNDIIDELAPGKKINWSEVQDICQTTEPLFIDLRDKIWDEFVK